MYVYSGFVYSGMGPDFRVLTRNARKAAQKYFLTYREVQPLAEVVRESALVMQEYTQSGAWRVRREIERAWRVCVVWRVCVDHHVFIARTSQCRVQMCLLLCVVLY